MRDRRTGWRVRFVVPDGGGEGEEALEYWHGDSVAGPAAVAFEVELALEGVVDGLDDLAEWFEEPGTGPGSFVSEGGAPLTEPPRSRRATAALLAQIRAAPGELPSPDPGDLPNASVCCARLALSRAHGRPWPDSAKFEQLEPERFFYLREPPTPLTGPRAGR